MRKQKIFKNLDEQIDLLRERNLIIEDEDKVKQILLRENYFFINGYRHLFVDSTKNVNFITGTTFNELYGVFVFDRKIRNIFFKYLLLVENNIKSIISYQMSKQYGYKEKDYLDPKNFTQDNSKVRQVYDILNKMKRQIRINGSKHTATMHYMNNYGYIPMWILVKVLSFGIISELYGILKVEDQIKIAEIYGMKAEKLGIYLVLLSNFRNLCAHEDILYDHRTSRPIPDTEYHYKLNIPKKDEEYIYGKSDLYALIIMMKDMLREEEFRELIHEVSYEIDWLTGKIKVVPVNKILNRIGFPDNWRDITNL